MTTTPPRATDGEPDAIADRLDAAADGLEGVAAGAPLEIDAGPLTAVVAGMLSQLLDSSGNVSTALMRTAEDLRTARSSGEAASAPADRLGGVTP